jgi:hypothetical protein
MAAGEAPSFTSTSWNGLFEDTGVNPGIGWLEVKAKPKALYWKTCLLVKIAVPLTFSLLE